MKQIPLFKVFMPPDMGAILQTDVFDSGILTEGVWSDEFERKLTDWLQPAGGAVLTNSGTSALTLAYNLLGVGDWRDTGHVLTTPMTCMATNEPIDTMGGKIKWVDIDPTTGNMSVDSLAEAVQKYRTADQHIEAVVCVHWAGTPCDMKEIWNLCNSFPPSRAHQNYIPIVEDAAHALGSIYESSYIGNCQYSDYTCFSFQAIKHLTTGDGGLLTCRIPRNAERARRLRWFGLDRKYNGPRWQQDIRESGFKFHMNNINARIGCEQLNHTQRLIDSHRKNACIYDDLIDNTRITKLRRPPNVKSSHWIYTLLVDNPADFKQYMAAKGIEADAVHIRNDNYSVFKKFKLDQQLPGCDEFCSKMINIPVGWWLSVDDVWRIAEVVNEY